MRSHRLVVEARHDRRPTADRVRVWLRCPAGDLTVHITIGPADRAEHLIETLIEAHEEGLATGE